MTDLHRLLSLVRSGRPAILIATHEEADALALVREAAIELGKPVWLWTSTLGLHDGLLSDAPPVPKTENAAAGLFAMAKECAGDLCCVIDAGALLEQPRKLRALRELIDECGRRGGCVIIIEHDASRLPEVVRAHATPFELSLPTEEELGRLLRDTLKRVNVSSPIQVDITRGDLDAITRNLVGLTKRQAEQIIMGCVCDDRRFDGSDLGHVVAEKRKLLHADGLLEFVETPATLDEVGGLRRLKAWLKQRERSFDAKAQEFGLKPPRGVLLLGVQGAGKSLCAKAIATAWGRPLLRLDPGSLYDRFVGESERRLRDCLKQAEAMAPIVLWIDEIEKGFASAASRSTDGGLSQRMFGALLTWMQEHEAPVFLVATANDIEALPPELLRKGRFDEIFFVDLPDEATRRRIFEIHLKKRGRLHEGVDLARVSGASKGFSGAEIEQAVLSAMHDAFARGAEVDTDALLRAIEASPPLSVTMRERIGGLREWARERCAPAD